MWEPSFRAKFLVVRNSISAMERKIGGAGKLWKKSLAWCHRAAYMERIRTAFYKPDEGMSQ